MRVPQLVIPVLVLLAAVAGLGSARLFAAPSFTKQYPGVGAGRLSTAAFTVRGLRCVDTALTLSAQLDDLKGVRRCTAYASRSRAEVVFDPALTSATEIKKAIEGPVYDPETQTFSYHLFTVVEFDLNP